MRGAVLEFIAAFSLGRCDVLVMNIILLITASVTGDWDFSPFPHFLGRLLRAVCCSVLRATSLPAM